MWEGRTFENDRAVGVVFTLRSPDGDEGYPGNVTVQVRCVRGGVGLGIYDVMVIERVRVQS